MSKGKDELSDALLPALFVAGAEDEDLEQNVDFQALQLLMEDESPEDTANNYRDEGNLNFKKGKVSCGHSNLTGIDSSLPLILSSLQEATSFQIM